MSLPYDVIEKICTFVSDKKQFRLISRIHNFIAEPIIHRNYSSIFFTKAAVENDLPLLIRIYNTVDKKEELIHLKDDFVFHESARLGNVSIVNQLYIWMNGDIRQIKLHIEKYSTTLLECSSQGHTAMLTQFYNWSSKEEQKKLIQLNYYACFRTAANYGHLVTMETVFNWAGPKQKIKMISAQEYLPFRVLVRTFSFLFEFIRFVAKRITLTLPGKYTVGVLQRKNKRKCYNRKILAVSTTLVKADLLT